MGDYMEEGVLKTYDLDTSGIQKRDYVVMNEYGYNFESNKNKFIDYEKRCSRVMYSDIKKRIKKGKR